MLSTIQQAYRIFFSLHLFPVIDLNYLDGTFAAAHAAH